MLRILFHRLTPLSSVSSLLLCSTLVFAQSPAPRIRGPIETSPSIPLEGSLNPHTRFSDDLGPLAPDTLIHGVTLVFKRSSAQEADLQQLLTRQTDPSSPLYHHWLTPDEFAARFGIAEADIAATESWLQSHGFTIDNLSDDRITFSGTADQIQQAFGAELHHYRSNNETHFAPATDLSLPPALAPVTAAVLHLSDFRPKPSVRAIRPDYTTLSNQAHFLGPEDLYDMYDLSTFLGAPNSGEFQSLTIVGQSFVNTGYPSMIYNFQSLFRYGSLGINPVIVPGSGNEAIHPGDVGESEIDLEYSSSLLKDAGIFFVYTGSSNNYDVFDALTFAVANDTSPVISISYGICEQLVSTTDLQQYNAVFEQAAAQGQTIVASSGDAGATACAPYSSGTTAQQQQLAVSFPASSPYVTAVGGTQMAAGTFAPGSSNYWTSATNNDATASLLSYVPEVAWNEDSPSYGILASGGGASSLFPRPSWQTGVPGIPSGSYRLIPDIALQASVASPGYVICSDDPYIVGSLTDCSSGLKATNGTYVVTGGTSFGAPIFSALLTDLNQYEQSLGFGNVNSILYSLAAQPSVYASAFHDITSGTTACAIGDGNCGTPGTTGYATSTGYDMATGLGSLDFANLVAQWPSVPTNGAVASYLQVSGIPQTANPGASSAVSLTVTIGCGLCTPPAPTGSLLISVDGAAPTATAALVPPPYPVPLTASTTWNFVAPSTTGSHIVIVRYPGDSAHLPTSNTFSVLVGNVVPSGSLTLSANNLTLATNGTGSTQVTITPAGGYSGSLTWSASYTGGTATTLCYIVQSGSINGPTTATMQIGLGTACTGPSGSRAPSRVQRTSDQRTSLEPSRPPHAPAAATFLALILCGLLPSRRTRKLLPILSALTLAIILTPLTGCGGSGGSGSGGGGGTNPQPQVYTLTLSAKDSVNTTITASTTFTLTVNQ